MLVYLYGPPAVGKLTVAEKLAELTGFRLFHNHLTVNALTPVFDFGTEAFATAIHRLRLDVIFTNNSEWGGAEGRRQFLSFTDAVAERVAECGGQVRFVQLTAPDAVLLERVASESRRAHAKLLDRGRLREMLAVHDRAPRRPDDLVIDTSVLSPDEAAAAVVEELRGLETDPSAPPNRSVLSSAQWFNSLPSVQVAVGVVLRSGDGRILVVDPVYKPQWDLPGGALEAGEPPSAGCAREVQEELGLEVSPTELLCIDHQSMEAPRRDALRFLFDGGTLTAAQLDSIRTDPAELAGGRSSM